LPKKKYGEGEPNHCAQKPTRRCLTRSLQCGRRGKGKRNTLFTYSVLQRFLRKGRSLSDSSPRAAFPIQAGPGLKQISETAKEERIKSGASISASRVRKKKVPSPSWRQRSGRANPAPLLGIKKKKGGGGKRTPQHGLSQLLNKTEERSALRNPPADPKKDSKGVPHTRSLLPLGAKKEAYHPPPKQKRKGEMCCHSKFRRKEESHLFQDQHQPGKRGKKRKGAFPLWESFSLGPGPVSL